MTKYKECNDGNEASLYSQTTQAICIYLCSMRVCLHACVCVCVRVIQTWPKAFLLRRRRAHAHAPSPARSHQPPTNGGGVLELLLSFLAALQIRRDN